jgi:hypothetical protein
MTTTAATASAGLGTPETYLDARRSQNFAQPLRAGVHDYPGASHLALNEFALHGRWRVSDQSITPVASGATIAGRIQAARVYLVLTSAGNVARTVTVRLDGRPIAAAQAGSDVRDAVVTVRAQRLYELVSLPAAQTHDVEVDVPPGVSAYDFTFG